MWVQPFRSAPVEHIPAKQPTEPKVAVLLNPHARKVSKRVVRALSHVVPAGDVYLSHSELDAHRIAQQVVDRRYDTVFLGGGDGTITCFMNAIIKQVHQRRHHASTQMPRFGVLKLGTGNSVASVVKASPTRGDGFLDDVLRARANEVPGYRTLDLLHVDGKYAPFAGLGIDGKILNDYIWVKNRLAQGPLRGLMTGAGGYFTSVAFKTVPHYLTNSTAVSCEVINRGRTAYLMGPDGTPIGEPIGQGETLFKGTLMMAAAATIPFYGFEFKMFPFAAKRRGMMNLRLATLATTTILANLPSLWKGQYFTDGIKDFLVSDATIKFDRPMPFQIAGDAAGYREEVRFQVSQEPLDFVDFSSLSH